MLQDDLKGFEHRLVAGLGVVQSQSLSLFILWVFEFMLDSMDYGAGVGLLLFRLWVVQMMLPNECCYVVIFDFGLIVEPLDACLDYRLHNYRYNLYWGQFTISMFTSD